MAVAMKAANESGIRHPAGMPVWNEMEWKDGMHGNSSNEWMAVERLKLANALPGHVTYRFKNLPIFFAFL